MLEDILSNFKGHSTTPFVGTDGRYHTVYYIVFETSQYYVGKHSTDNYLSDRYFCSSKLANYMREIGLKYTRTVMYYLESSSSAIELETEILSTKKYYDNKDCLNCYPGSPPDSTGSIIVSYGSKFKMINPKLLDYYLEQGWERKGIRRIWINNGDIQKTILPENVDDYIKIGWKFGVLEKNKNRIFVYKNGEYKHIDRRLLKQFISDGWTKKHNVEGTKVLRKGEDIIKVHPDEIDHYLSNGFVHSSTVDGLIYIRKDKELKRVKESDLSAYLSDGWIRGNNTSGKTYVTDGNREIRINLKDLSDYPSWQVGRVKKIYLNNGLVERRLMPYDINEIDKLKQDGYAEGPLLAAERRKIKDSVITKEYTFDEVRANAAK